MTNRTAYIGLGSNLGDRKGNLIKATAYLAERAGTILALSTLYETEPWGFEAKTKFLNMVLSVKTLKEPLEILDICQNIERVLGRDRAAEGPRYDNEGRRIYHSRLIDIDLLYCEEALGFGRWREIRMEHPRLQLPHPKLPERAFAQELLRNVIVKENHKFV